MCTKSSDLICHSSSVPRDVSFGLIAEEPNMRDDQSRKNVAAELSTASRILASVAFYCKARNGTA